MCEATVVVGARGRELAKPWETEERAHPARARAAVDERGEPALESEILSLRRAQEAALVAADAIAPAIERFLQSIGGVERVLERRRDPFPEERIDPERFPHQDEARPMTARARREIVL